MSEDSTHDVHVVFGAGGALGSAIVMELVKRQLPVRAVVHWSDLVKEVLPKPIVVEGDALNKEIVKFLCRDAVAIYHCIEVPIHQYSKKFTQISKNLLEAAITTQAKLLFPGDLLSLDSQNKMSKKTQIRQQIESDYIQAHQSGNVSLFIPRFPEYYGPNVKDTIFDPIFKAAMKGLTALWPVDLEMGQHLLYVHDAAKASVELVLKNSKTIDIVVPGMPKITGSEFLNLIYNEFHRSIQAKPMNLKLLNLKAMLSCKTAELKDRIQKFQYQWDTKENTFSNLFPNFSFTPHPKAIRDTIHWYKNH